MGWTVTSTEAPVYDHTGFCRETSMTCHKTLMKYVAKMDVPALMYVAKDCRKAAEALPDNPKVDHYLDTALYCGMELRKRQA